VKNLNKSSLASAPLGARPAGSGLLLLLAIPLAALLGRVVSIAGSAQITMSVALALALVLGALAVRSDRITVVECLAALVFLMSALVDAPRDVAVGPITALGVATMAYVVMAVLVWLPQRLPGVRPSGLRLYWWFVLWALVSFAWHPPSVEGFQNVAVFSVFALLAALAAKTTFSSPPAAESLSRWFDRASILAVSLYLLTLAATGFQAETIMSARGFALFGLLVLARALARFRYQSRAGLWLAVATLVAILGSLSRTSLAICILLVPLAWLDRRSMPRRLGVALAIIITAGTFAYAATAFGPLHDRFSEPDKVQLGGRVDLSVSGRGAFWAATWASYLESPWIGHGAGSSERIVQRRLTDLQARNYTHPHNDYLRLLHDYGVIGAGLWLLGLLALFRRTRRAWIRAAASGKSTAAYHMTAFLALLAVALAMITDNMIVYVYTMAPLGLLVGTSLGLSAREHGGFDGPPVDRAVAPGRRDAEGDFLRRGSEYSLRVGSNRSRS
jgi:O-antigen ligase